MAAPVIYRSTDTNAPSLFGGAGSLISLLDAILVNGYGSAFATGTITNDGTNVADGDTVTLGSVTYTFRASLTSQPANTILIGASGTASLTNLRGAIIGENPSSTYTPATIPNPDAYVSSSSAGLLNITARKGGSAGNSIALSRTSAGTPHIGVSGATLTSGSGSDTKAGAGWTKPYGTFPQGVYRQPAGSRFYLQVDDSGPGAGAGREARSFGFEAMTAYNVGTGQFPTTAQSASGSVIRKSVSLDNVTRAWIAFVDDRTLYLFTFSGDQASHYHGFSFGDFYSLVIGDAYKCLIMGGSIEAAGSVTLSHIGQTQFIQTGSVQQGHWLSRNYSGLGGSTAFVKAGDYAMTTGSTYLAGTVGFPNSDGGLYLAPVRVADGSNPGASIAGSPYLRGRLRGMFHICHQAIPFADGDVIAGSGAYAGRTFLVIKYLHSASTSIAFCAIETTPWAVSA